MAIGQPVPRVDGPPKVAGLTRYVADLRLPRMLHARLVLSPHAHARIVTIDARAARALPGVVAVLGGRDLKLADPDPSDRNRAPLALERAVFAGHPVAVVVAETEAIAEDAASLVGVEYEPLPAVVDPLLAMRPDAPRVAEPSGADEADERGMHGAEEGGESVDEPRPPNVAATTRFRRGDIARGFADADLVVERRYTTSMVHQGYLEPQAAVAEVDPQGRVTVWASTQALFHARAEVAAALGLPEHRVLGIACLLLGAYYRIPHLDVHGWEVLTHKPGSGAYRAPGAVQATFAIESHMDELARGLGLDPLELRLLNAVEEGDPLPNGKPWPRIGLKPCLAELAKRRPQRTTPATPRWRRGVGIAVGGWLGGSEPASAGCRLDGDGSLSVVVGSVDLSGTNTALAQIAAESFGTSIERIAVI